ncbi:MULTISPECIES: glycoside hydrolase family 13 protein [unclassified Granulicatella]|uniref:glycoside hydrolase family 13 protein n=1 Tax=unclassified Granulicatella TaxID=2630493 RepID=UPI001073CA6F|nr:MULTISPECIES: glycoside hydrolase family 13 protein [unclassified Granulicatella]MBF0779652.1 alpha-glycosidase [Granulicatella sp. 19428wC4_WM01]TFU96308.1 alpha-glycosidase [Granulicatella sp. WM01]
MELSALLHRPESEYAYLYEKGVMHLRFRTKKDDVKSVGVLHGDPYLMWETNWQFDAPCEMIKVATTQYHDYWQIELGAEYNRLAYAFVITGYNGEQVIYADQGIVPYNQEELKGLQCFKLPYFHEVDRVKVPEWVKDTVWYQIFPERFANGNPDISPDGVLPWDSEEAPTRTDFYGGDLQGVLDHLDYLQQLGVNGLYFCPIFKAGTNHKYDTIDYLDIDEHFGDKTLFKTLVDQAHARGMKVMIDAVFNHIGHFSMQWQDVLVNQEQSKYADWFHILRFPVGNTEIEDIENTKELPYETFAFSANMPKLNTDNKEVQEYLLHIATYWIKECDIDAWRLDVANEVDHQFWKKFYAKTTALKSDFYILGEIWHSSQRWLDGDEFHAVMNYAFTDSIKECIVKGSITPDRMVSQLQAQRMLYRQQTSEVMFNLLDSHDTPRILTVANNDMKRVQCAFVFMFLQQGTPCIYYGTEVGMTGDMDPDCRKPMWWDEARQNKQMLAFIKRLVAFRKRYSSVIGKGHVEITVKNNGMVCMTRKDGHTTLTGYFNLGEHTLPCHIVGNFSTQQHTAYLAPFECVVEVNSNLLHVK